MSTAVGADFSNRLEIKTSNGQIRGHTPREERTKGAEVGESHKSLSGLTVLQYTRAETQLCLNLKHFVDPSIILDFNSLWVSTYLMLRTRSEYLSIKVTFSGLKHSLPINSERITAVFNTLYTSVYISVKIGRCSPSFLIVPLSKMKWFISNKWKNSTMKV